MASLQKRHTDKDSICSRYKSEWGLSIPGLTAVSHVSGNCHCACYASGPRGSISDKLRTNSDPARARNSACRPTPRACLDHQCEASSANATDERYGARSIVAVSVDAAMSSDIELLSSAARVLPQGCLLAWEAAPHASGEGGVGLSHADAGNKAHCRIPASNPCFFRTVPAHTCCKTHQCGNP